MGLFRITHTNFEQVFDMHSFDTEHIDEWNEHNCTRLQEKAWVDRYEHESNIVSDIIETNSGIKSILEIGSGPGILSQHILKKCANIESYHLIDKPNAKTYFDDNNFKGTFFVKDLSSSFPTDGLLPKYDLVIANDFLEHVFNPHIIVKTVYELTHENSIFLISNPNWRMSHQYVYRGLFDFDNFIYFLYTHLFQIEGLYKAQLQTPYYPRLDSETLLSDENLTDWNHYMIFKHRK